MEDNQAASRSGGGSLASAEEQAAWVMAAQRGDRAGFDALIRCHFGLVYTIALARLGHREAAEDLAQEVFLRAWLNIGELRDPNAFAPWVARQARNLATDWKRRRQFRSKLLEVVPMDKQYEELPDVGAPGPADVAAQREHREILRRALQKLPPESRELVMLHYGQDLSRAEIGRRLGLHPSNVGRQLVRALDRLQRLAGSTPANASQHLREVLGPEGPRSTAELHAVAIVSAVSALTPEGQAAVAVAAKATAPSVFATFTGFAKYSAGITATGIEIMKTKTIIAAGAAVLVFGGGAWYAATSSSAPPAPQAAVTPPSEPITSVAWQGSSSHFVPFGQSLTLQTPPSELGRITTTLTAEANGTMAVSEQLDWSGGGNYVLDPDAAGGSGPLVLPGSHFRVQSLNGDELLLRSIIVEEVEGGMRCHLYTRISPTGGRGWFNLMEAYGAGLASRSGIAAAVADFVDSNDLLPPADRPLERERWEEYFRRMEW